MGATVLLAYGGVYLLLFYIYAAIISFKNSYFTDHRKTWFLVVSVLSFNLFVSNCAFSYPYIFVIAAAYATSTDFNLRMGRIRIGGTQHKKELSI